MVRGHTPEVNRMVCSDQNMLAQLECDLTRSHFGRILYYRVQLVEYFFLVGSEVG